MGDVFGLQIVIVGVGACAVFDVWQRIFQWFTAIPPSNWAIVGRWTIGLLTSGQLMVRDLELRPNRRNELGVGWFVHYGIAVGICGDFHAIDESKYFSCWICRWAVIWRG